ncbi:YybH family protein [Chitinimonas naiadis]
MTNTIRLLLCAIPLFTLAAPLSPMEVVETFHASMAAGKQAEVEALLLPDVLIYESGYVERSRKEYASHHLPEDIAYAKISPTHVLKRNMMETGDLALVTAETETLDARGKTPTQHAGTETIVLKRLNGEWRIAHVHWSSHKRKGP